MPVFMTQDEYNNLPRMPGRDQGRRLLNRVVPWGIVGASEKAHQRQKRDEYIGIPAPPNACLRLSQAHVEPISKSLAASIILRYEWLGTMQKTDLHYGIFLGPVLDEYCAGVSCIGGQNVLGARELHRRFSLEPHQVRVLARGACVHWAVPHTNSKLTAAACRLVHRDDPAAKLIVAYADEEAGEIGTIYQACNWTYIGKTLAEKSQYVSPPDENGEVRVYDRSIINARARRYGTTWAEAKWDLLLNHNYYIQGNSQKHIFVYILDRKDRYLKAAVQCFRRPYPKRRLPNT